LPESQFPGDITKEIANKLIDQKINGADALGKDPATGKSVYVLSGRYGPYVQLGENEDEKPKRMAIPPTLEPEKVDMAQALQLLELPKNLGDHPVSGKVIKKGLGRFGPYVVHEGDFRSIPKGENIFAVDLTRALELLAQPKKGRGRAAPLKTLGEHPGTKEPIELLTGKYGPYIKFGKKNISLPEDAKPETFTYELALKLIEDKGELGAPDKEAPEKKVPKKKATRKKAKAGA
jgi:DNA topoisomerase I